MKVFDNLESLEFFLLKYMETHHTEELYVYMRYGYTEKEMREQKFEIQVCGWFEHYDLLWWIDWNEGQQFSEIFSIITREELEKIGEAKIDIENMTREE